MAVFFTINMSRNQKKNAKEKKKEVQNKSKIV